MAKTGAQRVKESKEKAGLKSKSLWVTDDDWSDIKSAAKKAGMSITTYIIHAHRLAQAGDNARPEKEINAALAQKLEQMAAELRENR